MNEISVAPESNEALSQLGKKWGWLLTLGILFVVLGIAGLGMSTLLTVTTVIFFGFMLLFGGLFQLLDAFRSKGWKSVIFHILIGLLYIGAGAMLIARPAQGALLLTAFLGGMILAAGVARLVMGFQMRGSGGWGLIIFSGAISIVLAIMIFAKWPYSGLWFIGLVVAIEMITHGAACIAMALAAKAVRNAAENASASADSSAPV